MNFAKESKYVCHKYCINNHDFLFYLSCQKVLARGKEILEQLSKQRFLRSLKIAPFSSLLRSSGEKPAIFELCKNVAMRVVPIFLFLHQNCTNESRNY